MLNGHRGGVPVDLDGALRVLRQKKPRQAGYKVWIDALSVNQDGIEERGQQVTIMGRI